MKLIMDTALTFDDVILEPRHSNIKSRYDKSIDLSTKLHNLTLELPIISTNMDTITELTMANLIQSMGGLGIIHRFMTPQVQADQLAHLIGHKVVCIGVGETEYNRLKIINKIIDINTILIDIAHGDCREMELQIKKVRECLPKATIIAGNVATKSGVYNLKTAGADVIKCGIGSGSLCSTRRQTGNGVPQFSAITECSKIKVPIIADGGIKNSGDVMKALACGASAVMIGSLLAGCDETPGQTFMSNGGQLYKRYRGMASAETQLSWKGMTHNVEGESQDIPYKGKASKIIEELKEGLLSGMSYQGATNLKQLYDNATFRIQTRAGYTEGLPYGKIGSS